MDSLDDNDKPYKCRFCFKAFAQERYLKDHVKIHSTVRPFQCPICHKCFKKKQILREHLISHSDERRYRCPVRGCGEQFKHNSSLYRHKRNMHKMFRNASLTADSDGMADFVHIDDDDDDVEDNDDEEIVNMCYYCQQCLIGFTSFDDLAVHWKASGCSGGEALKENSFHTPALSTSSKSSCSSATTKRRPNHGTTTSVEEAESNGHSVTQSSSWNRESSDLYTLSFVPDDGDNECSLLDGIKQANTYDQLDGDEEEDDDDEEFEIDIKSSQYTDLVFDRHGDNPHYDYLSELGIAYS